MGRSQRSPFLAPLLLFGSAWLVPQPVEAQVAFFPVVDAFPNGVGLNVTPVVSHDRRYVRMTLNFQSTAIEGFDTIAVPGAVGGGTLGGGPFGGGGGGGAAGGGGGGRIAGRQGPANVGNGLGNLQAPIAAAKGPSIIVDPVDDLKPDEPESPKVAAGRVKPNPKKAKTTRQTLALKRKRSAMVAQADRR